MFEGEDLSSLKAALALMFGGVGSFILMKSDIWNALLACYIGKTLGHVRVECLFGGRFSKCIRAEYGLLRGMRFAKY